MPTSLVVKKGSKILPWTSSATPGPSSFTSSTTICLAAVVPGADHDGAAAVRGQHRLLGVHQQVEQHLLHLVAVGEDLRQPRRQRRQHRDVGDALFVGAQAERLADDVVEVDHRPRALPLAREGQQVADDAGGPLRFAEDHVEAALHRLVARHPLRQPLGPRQDGGQRVVQLVGHARDRLARAPPSSRSAAAGSRGRATGPRGACAR